MTDDMMTLRSTLEKGTDADLLREMIRFAAYRLMKPEVRDLTGAAPGERSAKRLVQSNGYRDRELGDQSRDGRAAHPEVGRCFGSAGAAARFRAAFN